MKNKWLPVVTVGIVLLVGYTMLSYGQEKNGGITAKELDKACNGGNPQKVAEHVLTSTGREGQFDLADAESITVYYGDVLLGESQDAIISVSFGPQNTILTAYSPEGNEYQFAGEVGEFNKVTNVQFVPIKSLDRDIVIVREYSDQRIGSFEENTFIRGFLAQEDGGFAPVLNTPEDIQASWNRIWDQGGVQMESNWIRVIQDSESVWEKEKTPVLNLTRMQRSFYSDDTDAKNMPKDETFQQDNERVIIEKYYWSDNWDRFILEETVDSEGNPVAVIRDFDSDPYTLTDGEINKSAICREDGSIDVVDNSELQSSST